MRIQSTLLLFGFMGLILITLHVTPALAENISREQLRSLMPDETDLQSFVRLQLSKFEPSRDATGTDSDFVRLNQDVTEWVPGRPPTPDRAGTVSIISRNFASLNSYYTINVDITLCDTSEAAKDEVVNFRHGAQIAYTPGTLSGGPQIGEESWVASNRDLLCRVGRLMFFVSGDTTPLANKQGDLPQFPVSAIEAVANQILLRASQQASLTGVPAQNAHLAVNGHALPKNAMKVAGRVYVPVQEFAKTMGRIYAWNAKTGALTLSGPKQKTVTLTAGSAQASVGGEKAEALSVPVLKSGGQPVMTLDDLLRLTGGRVTGHSGNTLQIKG